MIHPLFRSITPSCSNSFSNRLKQESGTTMAWASSRCLSGSCSRIGSRCSTPSIEEIRSQRNCFLEDTHRHSSMTAWMYKSAVLVSSLTGIGYGSSTPRGDLVPEVGVEPTRKAQFPPDFESGASANSATPASL